MIFNYSAIRIVPDSVRGEFVNVGVIAGSDEARDWAIRTVDNPSRARRAASECFSAAWSYLGELMSEIDSYNEAQEDHASPLATDVGEQWFRALAGDLNNIVQLGPIMPVVAETAEQALDLVFDRLVETPSEQHRAKDRRRARGALQSAYLALIDRSHVLAMPRLKVRGSIETVDLAVANGRAVQLAQTWSFQIRDQEGLAQQVQSWGWAIERLRTDGGVLEGTIDGAVRQLDVDRDCDIAVVCLMPEDPNVEGWRSAQSVFKELSVEPRTTSEVATIAEMARSLLDARH